MLTRSSRVLILGDWITQFTYAVFDGGEPVYGELCRGRHLPVTFAVVLSLFPPDGSRK